MIERPLPTTTVRSEDAHSTNTAATNASTAAAAAPVLLPLSAPLANVAPPVLCACETWYPKFVPVTATPLTVDVYALDAVALAVHAVHVVHGALLLQLPVVHPLHVDGGHALPPHHDVHSPVVHAPPEAKGPKPPWPPKGEPSAADQPPVPLPNGPPPMPPKGNPPDPGKPPPAIAMNGLLPEFATAAEPVAAYGGGPVPVHGPPEGSGYCDVNEAQSDEDQPDGCADV
jgi:hypothetical protein